MDLDLARSPERTRAALDGNDLAYWTAMMGSSAAGENAERRDVALVCCGAPMALFRIAHLKPPITDPTASLAHAEAYFGRMGFDHVIDSERYARADPSSVRPESYDPVRGHSRSERFA